MSLAISGIDPQEVTTGLPTRRYAVNPLGPFVSPASVIQAYAYYKS